MTEGHYSEAQRCSSVKRINCPLPTEMDALLIFIENVFPNPITSKLAIEGLNSLGVETIDDLQFLKDDDLGGFLRPIEARKLIAQIPSKFSNQWLFLHIH